MPRLLLGVLACALLAACARSPPLDQLARGETGRVAQVRSGDLLVLDTGLVVRLAGLEAPAEGEPHADDARTALGALAADHEVILLYGGARRDAYGRALAHVRRKEDRLWVQGELLRAGHARVRTYADNRALARPMLDAEARARQGGEGLWRDPAYRVKLADEVSQGFQVIEARVERVVQGGDELTVRFSHSRLTGRIPDRSVHDFESGGLSPQSLTGRLVRVRGGVRPDLTLRLDHPEAVEMLTDIR